MFRFLTIALCAAAAFGFQAPMTQISSSQVARSAAPLRTTMVVMEEVEDKVKSIIAEQLGVEVDTVVPDASFTEDLGADSLDAVELIMAIEEAFDIEIPDEEAETMTTPADCVTAIKAKL